MINFILAIFLLGLSPNYVRVSQGYVWTFQSPRFNQDNLRGRIGGPGWFKVQKIAGKCKGKYRWVKIYNDSWVCTGYLDVSYKNNHNNKELRDWFSWFRPGPYFKGIGIRSFISKTRSGLYSGKTRSLRGLRGFLITRKDLFGGRPLARTFDGYYIDDDFITPFHVPQVLGISLTRNVVFPISIIVSNYAKLLKFYSGSWREYKNLPKWTWREVKVVSAKDLSKDAIIKLRRAPRYGLRRADIRVAYKPKPPQEVGTKERWIYVDLDENLVFAMQGSRIIRVIPANTGPNTPTGKYRIYWKVLFDTMDRQNVKDPYFVEAVPYVLYFKGDFALHAAYWQTEFGYQTSHGCINLPIQDAAFLFAWTSPELPKGFIDLYTSKTEKGTLIYLKRNGRSLNLSSR